MKRILLIMAVSFVAISAFASDYDYDEETVLITGTTNTATSVTQNVTEVRGQVMAIHVILGTATNVDVDIAVNPAQSLEDSYTLYSADDVTSDTVLFPRFDAHDSAGTALTSDEPIPYLCLGDPIECVVSDWASTGATVRVKIVYKQ